MPHARRKCFAIVARLILALTFGSAATSARAQPEAPAGASPSLHAPTSAPASTLRDRRLEPHERVFGVMVGDEPRAYAVSDLRAAEVPIHDSVGGNRIEVGVDADEGRVTKTPVAIGESRTTHWWAWAQAHPDTSLWRPPAVAEPDAVRPRDDIRVKESRSYRTGISCATVQARLTSTNIDAPGLFVISGSIENVAQDVVHHVVLRYELIDDDGRVVYRDEGLNRSAEALAAPKLTHADDVVPIVPGATDTFRMIFLSDELPRFRDTRVSIARVY